MSGAQTSSFYPVNQLLVDNAQQIQNQYAPQRNELFVQRAQQEIGAHDTEAVARVSQWMLAESGGDEAKMAALYPGAVADLQRQGLAKNAPSQFPGAAAIRRLGAMGISAEKQYERQGNIAVGRALVGDTGAIPGAVPAVPGAAPGGGATFAGGIAGFEGGGNAMPPENPRWPVARGGPAGAHQFIASTWNEFAKANPDLFKGMSPEQILAARNDTTAVGPNGETRSTLATNWYAGENAKALTAQNIEPTPTNLGIAHALGAGGATKVLSAPDNTPLSQVIPETIGQNPQYGRMTVGDLKRQYSRLGPVGGSGAPGAGGGVAARTGGTDVAGPGAGASGASPAPAAGQFTPQQQQKLRVLAEAGRPTSEIIALQNQFRDENTAAANTAYQRQKDAETQQISRRHLELSEDANRRANDELAEKARVAGETFVPGTGIEAVHENTVQKYAAKVAKGQQLTDDEQRLYDGAYYALQQTGGQTGVMTDPNNPGQQIPFQTTRRLSPSLPEPKGGALPAVISQPGAAKKEAVSTEQSKAAGFADRVQQALPIIEDTSPAAMNRWQQLLGKAPLVGNSLVTPEFQLHMQAERNFINAVLRRESGMAIGVDEFVNARQQYIPQPGDSPQVLAQKKQNRETQLAGIIRDAGPSYKPATSGGAPPATPATPSRVIRYDHTGKRIEE